MVMSDMNNNPLAREDYLLPQKAEKKYQRSGMPWWGNMIFVILLTVVLSYLDYLVLFSIMDHAITQSKLLGTVTAVLFAGILNTIPLFAAYFAIRAYYYGRRFDVIMTVSLAIAFTCFFGATVKLRYAYQDMYKPADQMVLVNTMQTEVDQKEEKEDTSQSSAVVFILSIEPLVTSIMNFALGWVTSNTIEQRYNCLRLRRLELQEHINQLEAILSTNKSRESLLRQADLDERLAMEKIVDMKCERLDAISVLILMEYLRNPDATSYIMENSFENE